MTTYKQMMVVGLAFKYDQTNDISVLLVNKQKPKWQVGLWNGVGGKCEFGETPLETMTREFTEETGYELDEEKLKERWRCMAVEFTDEYELHVYKTIVRQPWQIDKNKNDAGETMQWVRVVDLHCFGVVGNLRWMVPLALDWRTWDRETDSTPYVYKLHHSIEDKPTW